MRHGSQRRPEIHGSNFGCTLRCEFFPHSFSQSSSDGTVTSACFAYARCTALELWPNACCANRSGKPHFNARSAHAYRYECSDTPEIPSPSHRCLNSVTRSPARTVQRYGNSGPAAGRRFKSASISALNRNSVGLRFVPRAFNFLRVKQIVRASQLMSSARRV